jgi:hypothetical protein
MASETNHDIKDRGMCIQVFMGWGTRQLFCKSHKGSYYPSHTMTLTQYDPQTTPFPDGERDVMKRFWLTMSCVFLLGFLVVSVTVAQQQATLAGIARVKDATGQEATPANTKVAIHLVNTDNAWQREIASVVPTAGTFSIQTAAVNPDELTPLRNGAVLLPGLQNEYTVAPEGVNFAKGQINMYVDNDGNNVYEGTADTVFLGIASLENPIGFFTLVYVDQATTITGKGATLEFAPGWNVFTVRYPDNGDPVYAVQSSINDVLLDVFLP